MKKIIAIGAFALVGVMAFVSYSFSSSEEKSEKAPQLPLTCEQVTTTCPGTGGPAYFCRLQGASSAPDCKLTPQGECNPQIICR